MKKLLVLLGMLALLASACGGASTAKPEGNAGAAKVAIDSSEIGKQLIGTWDCEEPGDVLPQYKMGKPSWIKFNADGTYEYYLTWNGAALERKGTFSIDTSKNPVWIDFKQEQVKDKDGQYKDEIAGKSSKNIEHGVIAIKDGKLNAIWYSKRFFPRPEELGGTDTQIFKKK